MARMLLQTGLQCVSVHDWPVSSHARESAWTNATSEWEKHAPTETEGLKQCHTIGFTWCWYLVKAMLGKVSTSSDFAFFSVDTLTCWLAATSYCFDGTTESHGQWIETVMMTWYEIYNRLSYEWERFEVAKIDLWLSRSENFMWRRFGTEGRRARSSLDSP